MCLRLKHPRVWVHEEKTLGHDLDRIIKIVDRRNSMAISYAELARSQELVYRRELFFDAGRVVAEVEAEEPVIPVKDSSQVTGVSVLAGELHAQNVIEVS